MRLAARQLDERGTFRPSLAGLRLLRLRQFRFPPHALPALFRPAAALGGVGADKIALYVCQSAQHGNHQPPGAGAGVGPRLRKRAELRLGVHDLLDDGEQVEGAAREPVKPRHRHHVAGGKVAKHFGLAEYSVSPQITSGAAIISTGEPIGVGPRLRDSRSRPHIRAMQHIDLTDDETVALTKELHDIVENDRYPFSPRIRTLSAILAKLRPEPVREPLPPRQYSEPPSKGRYGRRG